MNLTLSKLRAAGTLGILCWSLTTQHSHSCWSTGSTYGEYRASWEWERSVERAGMFPVSRPGEKRVTEARWQRKVWLPSHWMEKGAVRLKSKNEQLSPSTLWSSSTAPKAGVHLEFPSSALGH